MRSCPNCSTQGRKVGIATVTALVRPGRVQVGEEAWSFCAMAGCPVVYYSATGATISQDDVEVRIGTKVNDPPHTVCYCFDHTEESIREEIDRTGVSTAFASIKAEVEAGNCACETKNPKGTCCLGDVRRVEQSRLPDASSASVGEPADDCCAVTAPPSSERRSRGLLAAGGSLLAATVASACCWLPLLLLAVGVSSAGVASAFESARPWLLGVASILLAAAFYLVYFRGRRCAPGESCATSAVAPRRSQRAMLWMSALLVAVMALFPNWIGVFLRSEEAGPVVAGQETVRVEIEGMHCEACTTAVTKELAKVEGVVGVHVDYEEARAAVAFKPPMRPEPTELIRAVERAGYRAHIKVPGHPEDDGTTTR